MVRMEPPSLVALKGKFEGFFIPAFLYAFSLLYRRLSRLSYQHACLYSRGETLFYIYWGVWVWPHKWSVWRIQQSSVKVKHITARDFASFKVYSILIILYCINYFATPNISNNFSFIIKAYRLYIDIYIIINIYFYIFINKSKKKRTYIRISLLFL